MKFANESDVYLRFANIVALQPQNLLSLPKYGYKHKLGKSLKFGILLPKLFLPTVRKNCSSDREKISTFFRSLEHCTYSNSKSQKNFS